MANWPPMQQIPREPPDPYYYTENQILESHPWWDYWVSHHAHDEVIMAKMPEERLAKLRAMNERENLRRERKRNADREAIAYVARDASALLDAHLNPELLATDPEVHAWYYSETPWLVKFAVLAARLAQPRSRGERTWVLRTDPGQAHNKYGWYRTTADEAAIYGGLPGDTRWFMRPVTPYHAEKSVHCRFCGVRLRAGLMRADYSDHPDVLPHTTQCALEVLAGLRQVVEPGKVSDNQGEGAVVLSSE